jgi:hypothetical protein
MARDFKVGVAIVGKDRASGVIGRSLGRLQKRVGGLTRGIGRMVGLAGGVGVVGATMGIYRLATSAATAGDTIAKTAKQAGISAQAFAELRHAADLSGVTNEEFAKGVVYFNRTLGDAKAGTGALTTILNKMSPALLESLKAADGSEEALSIFNAALAETSDESVRASLAAAGYGRAGAKIAPMFAKGTEAVAEARAEFKRYFGEIDGPGLKSAEDFIDSQARLKLAIGGAKYAIGSQLLPVLQPMIDRFRDWIVANKGLLKLKIAGWVETVGEKFGNLADWWRATGSPAFGAIVDVGRKIGEGFAFIAEKSGPGEAGILALGAAAAIAFGPIGLVATAIGAVAVNLDKFNQVADEMPGFLKHQFRRVVMGKLGLVKTMEEKEAEVERQKERRPWSERRTSGETGPDFTSPRTGPALQTDQNAGLFMGAPGQAGTVEVSISADGLPSWLAMSRPVVKGSGVKATTKTGRRLIGTEAAR